ncbi:MAG: response regulator [Desulfosarcina sp.]|nr:response regulator [Desulfobacterales bacterium]
MQEKSINDKKIRLLLIEDDKVDQMAFERFAKSENLSYDYTIAGSIAEAKKIIKTATFDIIVADYMLGDGTSLELFDLFREIPIIVTTGTGTEEVAVKAMKSGACDYIIKDPEGNYLKTLPSTVKIALQQKQNEKQLQNYHNDLESMVKERTAELQAEIVERKHAENTLKESRKKYQTMMEMMHELVYICSPDYRIEYMNPSMIKRTGHDATGEFCFKALHDLDEKCPWCMSDSVQKKEHVELNIVSPKDNRSYHFSQTPIVQEDGSISKMTIYRDTTDFMKLEAQLRQAEKMEAIGSLAGGIAHDFNNVLYAMMGYTELSMDIVPEGSNVKKNLQQVLTAAERAKKMVQQILTFSRKSKKETKLIHIQPVLKEALNLIRTALPSTITILQDIETDCDMVMADPTQIHKIIMNLGTNAYHAMRAKGGVLGITLRQEEISYDNAKYYLNLHPGPYIKLTVEDTGHGIDANIIKKIFDPYFTTKDVGEGTGMGLSVIHGIVMENGGDISVYSEPGKGTAFHIFLPVIKTGSVEQKIISAEPVPTGTEHILLIDDEEQIVQMTQQILESLGYHVTPHTSSVKALEDFRRKPDEFDLVITDMTLPGMTGTELAAALLNIRPDLPIILCTGFSELINEKIINDIGIRKYLMKPVTKNEIAMTVRNLLDE